jgi:hypothetical protein
LLYAPDYNSYVMKGNYQVPYKRLERIYRAQLQELKKNGKLKLGFYMVVEPNAKDMEDRLLSSKWPWAPLDGEDAVLHDGTIVTVTKDGVGAIIEVKDENSKTTVHDPVDPNQGQIASMIQAGEITHTNEQGELCAKAGARGHSFTRGSEWKVVKDLKGYPSHAKGGVDISIGSDGVKFRRGDSDITAAEGLVLPNNIMS